MTRTTITLRDHAKRTQTVSFDSGTALNAANFDAQKTLSDALVAAIGGVCNGVVADKALIAERVQSDNTPTDGSATIYTDWIVEYTDASTGVGTYRTRIGTPNLDAALRQTFSNEADLSNAAWVAFVDAFQNYVKTPSGNAASIQRIYLAD